MNVKSAQMYKKINFFNFFIALIGTVVIYFINKEYAVFFLLGLILASINLLFNLISVNFILCKVKNKYGVVTLFGFVFRVIIVCVTGLMVFNYSNFAIIAFILGYSSQLISLVLYGINIKECEGK
ncbi:ATP synthase subunit I [Clostridium sp. CM028]|uniref:ATP synthase subunit I n=1 Tax=unclassified Clostridium TaxID=2614128 RepID=UPI001C6E3591|nr:MULTISPECIES: ATP synthase subunit I [unclassified Clostridium]MBW9146239.1 ATP synthase subunit I [Clostridium sp. CM027]MBW9149711.1 ATP synthase subunit I [Clostridium sp. CM028]UVE39782.1 ATP synthase subunit I [Clostridium sp. CM027]WLC60479.1 ATP synthase subunit I [Clostridium sp. CM028]